MLDLPNGSLWTCSCGKSTVGPMMLVGVGPDALPPKFAKAVADTQAELNRAVCACPAGVCQITELGPGFLCKHYNIGCSSDASRAAQQADASGAGSKFDAVERPEHYTSGEIECIDAIRAALGVEQFKGFCRGNAVKYLWRYERKGGAEDLRKAAFYLDRLTKAVG
ncbi:MAG: DUF3310 domain-containing protein [Methylorubrum rhodinum]|uniref:DUF3310 domain-containing protein n=1 Tax=Methylorubrum rhodinum TaxID=29428 RepID=UPI003BAE6CB1